MRGIVLVLAVLIVGCGLSQKEKERVAAVTCAIMAETRIMDAAIRVEKINEARDKLGGNPFLEGDKMIQLALQWEVCESLVLESEAYKTKVAQVFNTN